MSDGPADAGTAIRHVAVLLVQFGAYGFSAFLVALAVPRLMGPGVYGRYVLVTSLAVWFVQASTLGFAQVIGRYVPQLIIHGDRDLDSPKKYSVDLLRSLQPSYADCPDNLRMNIHDEAGHELNRSMIQETVDWFRTHLIP